MARSLLMLWHRRHEFGGPEQQMDIEFYIRARWEWDERYAISFSQNATGRSLQAESDSCCGNLLDDGANESDPICGRCR